VQNDHPIPEIIVIDDGQRITRQRSSKGCSRNMESTLVKVRELPSVWIGKHCALYRGVQTCRGEYLLFLDADVRLAPGCITHTMSYATKYDSDLLTTAPVVKSIGFWEKVMLPVFKEMLLLAFLPGKRPLKRIRVPIQHEPIGFGGKAYWSYAKLTGDKTLH